MTCLLLVLFSGQLIAASTRVGVYLRRQRPQLMPLKIKSAERRYR